MRRLFIAFWRLVTALWRADRVRVSKMEGQLRRLSTGALIVVDAEPFRILERKATSHRGMPCLEYSCSGPDGFAVFRVFSHRRYGDDVVEWHSRSGWQMCHPSRIAVFDPGRHCGRNDERASDSGTRTFDS